MMPPLKHGPTHGVWFIPRTAPRRQPSSDRRRGVPSRLPDPAQDLTHGPLVPVEARQVGYGEGSIPRAFGGEAIDNQIEPCEVAQWAVQNGGSLSTCGGLAAAMKRT